jgi:hypothetical protein
MTRLDTAWAVMSFALTVSTLLNALLAACVVLLLAEARGWIPPWLRNHISQG